MALCTAVILSLALILPTAAIAAPDLTRKVGATIVDTGSEYYNFKQHLLSSADQLWHYKITIALPKVPAPDSGYPVLYMLDGNAALAGLNEQRFKRLQTADSPVIVTIAYDTEAYFDVNARAYDYTPPLSNGTPEEIKKHGGADIFWQFIEYKVKPLVAQTAALDLQRQAVWGHSFGGLFVLHTLFNHPKSFQTYIAADPSLWWQQGLILNNESAYQQLSLRPAAQVVIQRSSSHRKGDTLPDDATRRLAERLSRLPELEVQYHEYFKHTHGSLLDASIPTALRLTQGLVYE